MRGLMPTIHGSVRCYCLVRVLAVLILSFNLVVFFCGGVVVVAAFVKPT